MQQIRNLRVYFDFACPFCYNEFKFMEYVKQNEKVEWNIDYYSWELNPQTPAEGIKLDRGEHSSHLDLVNKLGASVGVQAGSIEYMYNTRKALQLLEEAKKLGAEITHDYIAAVFDAYFEKNINIADDEIIIPIAEKTGINNAKEIIATGKYIDVIENHLKYCDEIGLEVMPTIEENGKIILSGVLSLDDIKQEFVK